MTVRTTGRWLLGGFLILAGTAHLSVARETFRAQVPDWLPFEEFIVIASGLVEIGLGLALLLVVRHRRLVGWVVAAFFVAVLPGNINQLVTHADAFGLDTDRARVIRLFFQPLLIAWALWSTHRLDWGRQKGQHAGKQVRARPRDRSRRDEHGVARLGQRAGPCRRREADRHRRR